MKSEFPRFADCDQADRLVLGCTILVRRLYDRLIGSPRAEGPLGDTPKVLCHSTVE